MASALAARMEFFVLWFDNGHKSSFALSPGLAYRARPRSTGNRSEAGQESLFFLGERFESRAMTERVFKSGFDRQQFSLLPM